MEESDDVGAEGRASAGPVPVSMPAVAVPVDMGVGVKVAEAASPPESTPALPRAILFGGSKPEPLPPHASAYAASDMELSAPPLGEAVNLTVLHKTNAKRAETRRVIVAPDFRGTGDSSRTRGGCDKRIMAKDAIEKD